MHRNALLSIAALVSVASSSWSQSVPAGFIYQQVIAAPFTGEPVAFAFLPDHRIVFVERNGGVRISAAGSIASTLIHTIPAVSAGDERGLLGVAVDPDWPTRPYLYFYLTQTDSTSRLTMFQASGTLTDSTSTNLSLANEFLLLEIPDLTESHNGGGLEFGPDGMLYLSLGEDLLRCPSQDKTSLLGKLVRLDVSLMPGVGSGPPPKADLAPADNPFAAAVDENERLIWGWGLRNPFGFTIDPATGDAFIGDVGATQFEEVDLIPSSSGGGQNFGWPVLEGFVPAPFGDSCGVTNTFTDPIFAYPHGALPSAIIGGPLYRFVPIETRAFPITYDGMYFFADWGGSWIRRLVLGQSGWELAPPASGQPTAQNWAEGIVNITQVEEGPDGALYIMRRAGTLRGLYRIARDAPTGVAPLHDDDASLSVRAEPNPAGPGGTTIAWSLPRAGMATVRIVDVSGRTVRELVAGRTPAGPGTVLWDGQDSRGEPVAAGTYFCQLVDESGRSASVKVSHLR
jgi:glucose/arabinose dehydrogenase